MQKKKYKRLTNGEREEISRQLASGKSMTEIGKLLSSDTGTISREISERMKMEYPMDMSMQISHEAIYRYIYVLPRGELKQTLIKALRQGRKYRRKQKKVNQKKTGVK